MPPTTIPIIIDSRLRLALEDLPADVVEELKTRCTYDNPARGKLEKIAKGAKGRKAIALKYAAAREPETIATWQVELVSDVETWLTLPRGALGKVRDALTYRALAWSYDDRRSVGSSVRAGREPSAADRIEWTHRPDPSAADGGKLRWYQEEAVRACIAKQNCLLRAPTGSGKTSTLIAIIARLGLRTLVIVDNSELLRQWTARLSAELGADVGQIGGGVNRVTGVTVAMRQSLQRWKGDRRQFGVVMVDEVHRAAASTFMDIVDRFPSRYRIGASADETRADGKEFLVYDIFGEVAHEVTRDLLIDDGSVLDVECLVVPTDFRADWYVAQRASGQPDFHQLLDEITADADRRALVRDLVKSEVDGGEQVLVMAQRVELCERINAELVAAGVGSDLMLGNVANLERRQATLDGLRDGSMKVGVGTVQAVGTGIDIPSVGRGVLTTPLGSNRQLFGQIRGRLCRPGEGKRAALYVLWDQWVVGAATLKRMIDWNRVVKVRATDGTWVDGRAYLKRWKEENKDGS